MFIDSWNTHFFIEREAEQLRLNLQCIEGYNAYQYFQICDRRSSGAIDKEDIKELLSKYN
jgi:Ca2+-binding EF-hand superfamily protein